MTAAGWTAVGAIATGVMAIATFILAVKTRSMAKATEKVVSKTSEVAKATLQQAKAVEEQTKHIEQQVNISWEALRSSVQPWLVWFSSDEDLGAHLPDSSREVSMKISDTFVCKWGDDIIGAFVIRNVGTGLAFVNLKDSSIFNCHNPDTAYLDVHPSMESPIVSPGERETVRFKIPGTKGSDETKLPLIELVGGGGSETMYVELAYSDVLGAVNAKAKFQLYRKTPPGGDQESWRVIQTTYCQNGREPIVVRSV